MLTLKTLTYEDLKVGGEYIEISMDIGGRLFLRRYIMLSEPDEKGKFLCKWPYTSPGEAMEVDAYLETIGCPRGKRKWQDNFHRTVLDTPENLRVVESLVAAQDAKGWLTFLGVPDAESAMKMMAYEHAQFQDFRERLERTGPCLESAELLVARIESRRAPKVLN